MAVFALGFFYCFFTGASLMFPRLSGRVDQANSGGLTGENLTYRLLHWLAGCTIALRIHTHKAFRGCNEKTLSSSFRILQSSHKAPSQS
jgi:hypothetical protein